MATKKTRKKIRKKGVKKKAGAKAAKAVKAVKVSRATDAEKASYLQLAASTVRGLDDAIDLLLKRRVADTLSAKERRLINFKLPALEAERSRVLSEMLAFVAGTQSVRPPSPAQVKEAKRHATKLDKMIARTITASTVLNVTTKVVALYLGTATA